ncbi:MAG: hypothetical protein NPIRA04_24070 [Nitrospirales bacterium]|nr:MAG: hypothetical protein NPIRA04_24070 [Nitrospirales bacterium]
MVPKLYFKRSLPIVLTVCALAFTSPVSAHSSSLNLLSYSDDTPKALMIKNSRNYHDSHDDRYENRQNNSLDYYTDQYGDVDNELYQNRQNRRSHSRRDIYAGMGNVNRDELRQLDFEIREDIRDELDGSPYVDEDRVRVKVRRGVATLTGTVEDRGSMVAAVENAYEGGARKVINKLQVTHHDERPWLNYSDSRLESDLYDELGEGISVNVRSGVATLRGTVEDRSAMADAVETTYDIGARRVINKLRLRN